MTTRYFITGSNFPQGARRLIDALLADDRTTPDHLLITADHLDQWADDMATTNHIVTVLRLVASDLRELAPEYLKEV